MIEKATLKKSVLTTAMATALGVGTMGMPTMSSAAILTGDWTGYFTMLNPTGDWLANNDEPAGYPWYKVRTPVSGSLSFNTTNFTGTGAVIPFSFFGSGAASATTITFQAIGNGFGGPGALVLGNMGFNWAGNTGIPVSLVMNAAGFFGAVGAGAATTSATITGGVTAASEGLIYDTGALGTYALPMGAGPMVSTTWDTTDVATGSAITLGDNPSGTLPLLKDTLVSTNAAGGTGVGGSPMGAGPFPDYNANFDITSIHITPASVPVPAAVWLFGSGLLGLVGVARRRRSK